MLCMFVIVVLLVLVWWCCCIIIINVCFVYCAYYLYVACCFFLLLGCLVFNHMHITQVGDRHMSTHGLILIHQPSVCSATTLFVWLTDNNSKQDIQCGYMFVVCLNNIVCAHQGLCDYVLCDWASYNHTSGATEHTVQYWLFFQDVYIVWNDPSDNSVTHHVNQHDASPHCHDTDQYMCVCIYIYRERET